MANDNHLSSVTCYNVTMNNTKYYNEFFELGQQKITFSFSESTLPYDDPCLYPKKIWRILIFRACQIVIHLREELGTIQ